MTSSDVRRLDDADEPFAALCAAAARGLAARNCDLRALVASDFAERVRDGRPVFRVAFPSTKSDPRGRRRDVRWLDLGPRTAALRRRLSSLSASAPVFPSRAAVAVPLARIGRTPHGCKRGGMQSVARVAGCRAAGAMGRNADDSAPVYVEDADVGAQRAQLAASRLCL